MTEEIKNKAVEYFSLYPKENVLHISTDGQVFLHANQTDGVNHQRQFTTKNQDDKLVTIYRDKLFAVEQEEQEEDLTPDAKWKNAEIAEWLNKKQPEVVYTGKEKKDDLMAAVDALILASESEEEEEEEEETE